MAGVPQAILERLYATRPCLWRLARPGLSTGPVRSPSFELPHLPPPPGTLGRDQPAHLGLLVSAQPYAHAGPHLLGLQGEGRTLAQLESPERARHPADHPPPGSYLLPSSPSIQTESPTHRCHTMPGNVPGHRETTTTHSFPQHPDTEPWAKGLRPPCTEMPLRGPLGVQIHRLHPKSSSLSPDLGICMVNKHCRTGPSQGVRGWSMKPGRLHEGGGDSCAKLSEKEDFSRSRQDDGGEGTYPIQP